MAHPGGLDNRSLWHYIICVSTSPKRLAPKSRHRIGVEVDPETTRRLKVYVVEHDITVSDVVRNLLENWLHETNLALSTVSAPDTAPVKGVSHLLHLKEVASHFQVCRETVRRWVCRGEIRAVRIGNGGYRFDPAEVSRFQRKCSIGGRP